MYGDTELGEALTSDTKRLPDKKVYSLEPRAGL